MQVDGIHDSIFRLSLERPLPLHLLGRCRGGESVFWRVFQRILDRSLASGCVFRGSWRSLGFQFYW